MFTVRIPLERMTRAVVRTGKTVEFRNGIGGHVGQPYRYTFPSVKLAKEFEAFAEKKDATGAPVAISPEWWPYEER
jgi:hypothetical protein